ncbi:MAG: efflux RND transporter permease subunit [bacterium]|nr:efflux RND transporter permease subunit [bacterium]
MARLIEFLLNKSKIIHLILLFIFIAGIISIFRLKKYTIEPADYGYVSVQTIYPGASPRDVELKVTSRLEKNLKAVDGIKEFTSVSIEGYSHIGITLEHDSDFETVHRDIQKAIDNADDLPGEIRGRPVMTELNEDIRPMMEIAVTGKAGYTIKRKYAKALEEALLASPYVGRVEKAGYLKREVRIEADQARLLDYYVSIGELINAVQSRNFRMSTGDLIVKEKQKKYVVNAEFKNLKDVGNVIIRSGLVSDKITVSNVALIKDGFEKPHSLTRYNSNEAINLVLMKKPGKDIVKAVSEINRVFDDFKKTLPETVQAKVIVDYSIEVRELLGVVRNNALLGFILVVSVLFMMLNFRIAFWTALGIPTSILMAFILFPAFDISIHLISLFAIVLVMGMLVDDAIIISENIYRYREMGFSEIEAATKGLEEVIWPVITTVATTIIVFLPILGMTGTMGTIFGSIPIVVMLLLFASLVEGVFFLPVHIANIKIKKTDPEKKSFFEKIESYYEKIILLSLHNRGKTILIFTGVLLLSFVVLIAGMKFVYMDSEDGLLGVIRFETRVGSTIETTLAQAKQFEEVLKTMSGEEVSGYVTTIGEDIPGTVSYGEAVKKRSFAGNILIHLTPIQSRKRTAREIMSEIKSKCRDVAGLTKVHIDTHYAGPPIGRAVAVTFATDDDAVRDKFKKELKDLLKSQPGVYNIEDNQGVGKKRIDIKINYDLAAKLELRPLDIARTIRTAFNGVLVTRLERQGEEVDYRLILNKRSRASALTLSNLTIRNFHELTVSNVQGRLVPIGRVIKQVEKEDVLTIHHYQGERAITVFADINIDKNTPLRVNALIKEKFGPEVKKYPGMQMVLGGEEKDVQESIIDFMIAFIMAIIGICFILVILFNSYSQPLLVLAAIPFAFSGVIFAFFFHGMDFGIFAMIGTLGLMGVVVNDSLVMISFLNQKRKEEGLNVEAISNGARLRLRPIILTTVTTAAGMFPLAYGIGGGNSYASPMIMAIAWGLIFATVVTLILLPSLYMTLASFKDKHGRELS